MRLISIPTALKPALCPLRSHNEPFRKENACQNDHQVRYSISFLSRVEFWRSTTTLDALHVRSELGCPTYVAAYIGDCICEAGTPITSGPSSTTVRTRLLACTSPRFHRPVFS